jgi:hypothetical protein
MHTECDVKLLVPQLRAHILVGSTTAGLVENDKIDSVDAGHQGRFCLADNPGDVRVRPVILNATDDGEGVAGVANRGKAHNTNVPRLRLQGQIRQYQSIKVLGEQVR